MLPRSFVYVRPGVLASMSAGLLGPRSRVVYARAAPAQCPFHEGLEAATAADFLQDLGGLDQLIRDAAGVESPAETFLNAKSTTEHTSTVYSMDGDGQFSSEDLGFQDSLFSQLAVAFAITIAALVAVAAVGLVAVAADHINVHLDRQVERRLRFVALRGKLEDGTLLGDAIGLASDGDPAPKEGRPDRVTRKFCDLVEDLVDAHARAS